MILAHTAKFKAQSWSSISEDSCERSTTEHLKRFCEKSRVVISLSLSLSLSPPPLPSAYETLVNAQVGSVPVLIVSVFGFVGVVQLLRGLDSLIKLLWVDINCFLILAMQACCNFGQTHGLMADPLWVALQRMSLAIFPDLILALHRK